MIEAISIFLACVVIATETGEDWARDRAWLAMTEEQRMEASTDLKARAVGMTEDEFELMSRVIEAESDRSDSIDGRIMIALVLLNRMDDSRFPDDISSVCYESGQFEVVSTGAIWDVGRTSLSDWAIIEAHRWIEEGDAPHVLYFNNSGYNYGEPYGYIDGNYFVIA